MDAVNGDRPPRVSVVIPTLNEARNIAHVLATLPADIYEVLLVDGGSTDETVEVARVALPSIRVVGQPGIGKGDALAAGLAECTGDIVVMLDADGSADGAEIPRFVDALIAGADLAKGSRFLNGGGSSDLTRLRRTGNRFLCALVNVMYRTRYSDLCYGYNAGWVGPLRTLELDCAGFEVETVLSIRSAKSRLRITEVPSFESPRIFGRSNLRTFRDGWRVLCAIMREHRGPIGMTATAGETVAEVVEVLAESAPATAALSGSTVET
ncbi:MAG TPA: glycosyltransferase family 2 protein [Thermoleophilaceae bacterium]|jgi:glycosyltransferase involved in cell wall biosynthesis|nr:glycosyltransferase family 2 protein [Thermoleophilaceae bacterium]